MERATAQTVQIRMDEDFGIALVLCCTAAVLMAAVVR
jgi:hypothetical protein